MPTECNEDGVGMERKGYPHTTLNGKAIVVNASPYSSSLNIAHIEIKYINKFRCHQKVGIDNFGA